MHSEIAAAGGAIGFDRYMTMALYEPGLGYYAAASRKFGAAGDFVTAPELGPLFAACVATQISRWFDQGAPAVIWEFGAGSGELAQQLLNQFDARGIPVQYHIVEVSPYLRSLQEARLAELAPLGFNRTRWCSALPDSIEGVVIANELLDAMPVRLFELGATHGACMIERVVEQAPESGALRMGSKPASAEFARAVRQRLLASGWSVDTWQAGYRSELPEQASAWVASVGERLAKGAMLLIDYGFPAAEFYHPHRAHGTLNCHYRHRSHAEPLWQPGLSDITCHVDFSSVYEAANQVGLECLGFGSQGSFLLGCDFAQHFASSTRSDSRQQALLAREANTLVSEAEMGELFKVIAFGQGVALGALSLAGRDRQSALASPKI